MGACCCFEVPPRIWKRPIKQDYKSGKAFLPRVSIHTFTGQKNYKTSLETPLFPPESTSGGGVKFK